MLTKLSQLKIVEGVLVMNIESIGYVNSDVKIQTDKHWGKIQSQIIINKELVKGLIGLSSFSHIIVVYHLNEAGFIKEKHLIRRPQGREDMPMVGIFAQRAKDRPNPIGITAVKLLSINDNIINVEGLDAINDTPVLDIKPYYPQYDLKNEAIVPEWVNVLMKEYF